MIASAQDDTRLTLKRDLVVINWDNPNNLPRITDNWEVRRSLYEWFQVSPGETLRKLKYPLWGEILPLQTRGSSLYRSQTQRIFAITCDSYKEDKRLYTYLRVELQPPSVPKHIPCLIHPKTGHASWIIYKCRDGERKCYCSSQKRHSRCMICHKHVSPILNRQQLSDAEIFNLLFAWELLIPVEWEVPEERWETTVKKCQKLFAWKVKKRK